MKRAFTLVELLVVITIIGILTAVLVRTFSGAGDAARAAKCLSNLHNLAMAVQSYAMGNDKGTYPSAKNWISPSSKDKDGNGSFISPYDTNREAREFALTNGALWAAVNRSRETLFCPTHQRYARDNHLGEDPVWSYVMNGSFSGSYGSVDRADRTLLFAELPFAKVTNDGFTQTGEISGDELDPVLEFQQDAGESGNEVIGFNHWAGKNLYGHVCYVDGHVEKLIAPRQGDAVELTGWLCNPTEKVNGVQNDFDVIFDGKRYKRSDDAE